MTDIRESMAVDWVKFGRAVVASMGDKGVRGVERESGVSKSAVSRVAKNAGVPDAEAFVKLLLWMGKGVGEFLAEIPAGSVVATVSKPLVRPHPACPEVGTVKQGGGTTLSGLAGAYGALLG